MNEAPNISGPSVSGKWVFWIFAGFFGVIFGANAVFVMVAFDSHSGTAESAAYDKGLAYNDRIEAAAVEAGLGWVIKIEASRIEDGRTELRLAIADRDGAPLDGLDVTGRLVRTVVEGYDVAVRFDGTGDGHYCAHTDLAFPGRWQLRILAEKDETTFRLAENLNL